MSIPHICRERRACKSFWLSVKKFQKKEKVTVHGGHGHGGYGHDEHGLGGHRHGEHGGYISGVNIFQE